MNSKTPDPGDENNQATTPRQTKPTRGTYERRFAVLAHVLEQGFSEVLELANKFKCHPNPIRGDVRFLAGCLPFLRSLSRDVVVSLVPAFGYESLAARLGARLDQKWAVARKALELVEEKDIVFLSGGATNFLLAL